MKSDGGRVRKGMKYDLMELNFLLFSSETGSLLHGVRLPSHPHAVEGASQLTFLPDSATVLVMCNDGEVREVRHLATWQIFGARKIGLPRPLTST